MSASLWPSCSATSGSAIRGGRLTRDLLSLFSELGFCTFEAAAEERHAWVEANGAPDTAGSPTERAVRQLHWDLVIEGSPQVEEDAFGRRPYISGAHQRLADWFVSLGYPATLDITQDRPEVRDLP